MGKRRFYSSVDLSILHMIIGHIPVSGLTYTVLFDTGIQREIIPMTDKAGAFTTSSSDLG